MLRRIAIISAAGALGAGALAVVSIRVGALFGVGGQLDAFFVGASLPSLLLSLSAGVMTPLIAPRLAQLDDAAAAREAGRWAALALTAGLVLAAVSALASPLIVSAVAPGLRPGAASTAASVLRLYAVTFGPTMMAHVYAAHGYANGRVWTAGGSTLLYGGCWIGLLFVPQFTHSVQDVALAGILATAVQVTSAFLFCSAHDRRPWPRWRAPASRAELAWPLLGVLVAVAVGRANTVLDPLFGSSLSRGSISELVYAWRIALLFMLVSGQGPAFTILAGKRDGQGSTSTTPLGLVTTVQFAVGMGVAIAIAFQPLAPLILSHGELGVASANEIGRLVEAYAGAVIVFVVAWSLESVLYSDQRVWVVAWLNVPSLVLNIALSAVLVGPLGAIGRPIAVTCAGVLYLGLLLYVQRESEGVRRFLRLHPLRVSATVAVLVCLPGLALWEGGRSLIGHSAAVSIVVFVVAAAIVLAYARASTRRLATEPVSAGDS